MSAPPPKIVTVPRRPPPGRYAVEVPGGGPVLLQVRGPQYHGATSYPVDVGRAADVFLAFGELRRDGVLEGRHAALDPDGRAAEAVRLLQAGKPAVFRRAYEQLTEG